MNSDWFARTERETDGKLDLLRMCPPTALRLPVLYLGLAQPKGGADDG
jgi:hypothetical protein